MALVWDGMPCAICGKPIENVDLHFATTMVGLPFPLSQLDDTAAHSECVDAWPLKEEFVARYNTEFKVPPLRIDEEGHVVWVRNESTWWIWWVLPLLPLLIPISLAIHLYETLFGQKHDLPK